MKFLQVEFAKVYYQDMKIKAIKYSWIVFYTSPELFYDLKKLNIGACVKLNYLLLFFCRGLYNGKD